MSAHLFLNTRDDFYRIPVSRIAYFVADKNYTELYLTDGSKLTFTFSLHSMQTYIEKTMGNSARYLKRVGRSHIINLMHVFYVDLAKSRLKLYAERESHEFVIPISKESLRLLKAMYVRPNAKDLNAEE